MTKDLGKKLCKYLNRKLVSKKIITLAENNTILIEKKEIEKIMNNFLINVTEKLDLKPVKISDLTDINVITSILIIFLVQRKYRNFFQILSTAT